MSRSTRTLHWNATAAGALAVLALAQANGAEPSIPSCMASAPVPIVVRIGDDGPRHALLRGGAAPALEIIDAATAQPLWSAAASSPASQRFERMSAQFTGSLLPLDLDGDGTHDRLYAGDLAGRLWRFDLHHGRAAQLWATGGVFADFSSGARGFVAAPDVSLAADPTGSQRWFNIALGTVRTGQGVADNRFYVLRDRFAFESRTQDQYDRWQALRESDLTRLSWLGAEPPDMASADYFIEIGSAQVLSPSLTVSGRATLAMSEPGAQFDAACHITVVVSSIDLATGAGPRPAADGSLPVRLAMQIQAGESFTLRREGNGAACLLGETRVPACDVDLSPRRVWWRREDAD